MTTPDGDTARPLPLRNGWQAGNASVPAATKPGSAPALKTSALRGTGVTSSTCSCKGAAGPGPSGGCSLSGLVEPSTSQTPSGRTTAATGNCSWLMGAPTTSSAPPSQTADVGASSMGAPSTSAGSSSHCSPSVEVRAVIVVPSTLVPSTMNVSPAQAIAPVSPAPASPKVPGGSSRHVRPSSEDVQAVWRVPASSRTLAVAIMVPSPAATELANASSDPAIAESAHSPPTEPVAVTRRRTPSLTELPVATKRPSPVGATAESSASLPSSSGSGVAVHSPSRGDVQTAGT